MKSLLMVAFHYPPEGSSSGVQRTLKFSRHLGEHGFRPVVLTAHPRAYRVSRSDQLGEVPADIVVERAFALDSTRHLAIGGRYLRFSALPDRWVSWWLGAVLRGLKLIRKHRPEAVWSTYPIATAHLIGWSLERLSGLPWIADFRDSMTEEDYPRNETQRRVYRWIERRTMARCRRAVFTTPGAAKMYGDRYPEADRSRLAVIANGFDEDNFVEAEKAAPYVARLDPEQVVLVHSGALYPSERDPRSFYGAVQQLSASGRITPKTLRVVLRAPGNTRYHRELIEKNGIGDIVTIAPGLAYREALREMLDVDGLLIFQASSCNHQIPAKLYEYLRAGRPILALTDPAGDTAEVIREAGLDGIVPLDDQEAIAKRLLAFIEEIRGKRARVPSREAVARYSRRTQTKALAGLLDEVIKERAA